MIIRLFALPFAAAQEVLAVLYAAVVLNLVVRLCELHWILMISIELSIMTDGYVNVTLTRTVGKVVAFEALDAGDKLPNQS